MSNKLKIFIGIIVLVIICFFTIRIVKNNTKPVESNPFSEIKKDSMGELVSDVSGLVVNENEIITVRALAKVKKGNAIDLYLNDECIGQMHDDGQDGDFEANDGAFTFKIEVAPKSANDKYVFQAKYKEQYSNIVIINVYEVPTEQNIEKENNVIAALDEIQNKYTVDGYVPSDCIVEAVAELSKEVSKQAEAYDIGIEKLEEIDGGVYIKFSDGIPRIYMLRQDGVESGGYSSELLVNSIEPYRNTYDSLPSIKYITQAVVDNLSFATYNYDVRDFYVSLEDSKTEFTDNAFVVWHGHGAYADGCSYLMTGEIANLGAQFEHMNDLITGRICIFSGTDERALDRFAYNYKYVEKYFPDLSGSFIYLGGCHTAKDYYLVHSFKEKGAYLTVGFSDSVYSAYDIGMLREIAQKMVNKDSDGEYFTFLKGYQAAVNVNGENDSGYGPDAKGAKIIYEGDLDYKFDMKIRKEDESEKDSKKDKDEDKKSTSFQDMIENWLMDHFSG